MGNWSVHDLGFALTGANEDTKFSFPACCGLSTSFLSDLVSWRMMANGQMQLPRVLPGKAKGSLGSSKTIRAGFSHDVDGEQTLPVTLYKTCTVPHNDNRRLQLIFPFTASKSLDLSRR